MAESMSIGEVARATGFSAPTLRYYEEIGLLPAVERVSGRRRYDPAIAERLGVIEVAKSAGLSLDETRTLLDGFPPRTPAARRWRHFAEAKLAELDEQTRRIEYMRTLLGHLMECWCEDLAQCAQAVRDCSDVGAAE